MKTPSCSLTVGRMRPMSRRRLRKEWLVSGRTWLLKSVKPAASTTAAASGPTSTEIRLTPLALSAVISLSCESRPKVIRTATSTEHGTDNATM